MFNPLDAADLLLATGNRAQLWKRFQARLRESSPKVNGKLEALSHIIDRQSIQWPWIDAESARKG